MENVSENHEGDNTKVKTDNGSVKFKWVYTVSPPVFSAGQHIKSKDRTIHGIIFKVSRNYYGWVYCIERKDWIGRACINENDCELF